jgi:hypothetical protein
MDTIVARLNPSSFFDTKSVYSTQLSIYIYI